MSQVQHRVISTTQCHKVTRPFPRCMVGIGGSFVLSSWIRDTLRSPELWLIHDTLFLTELISSSLACLCWPGLRTSQERLCGVWWPATIILRFAKPEPKCGHRDWARNFFGKQDKYWWLFQIGPLNWYKSLAVHQTAICCEQTVSRRSSVKWK